MSLRFYLLLGAALSASPAFAEAAFRSGEIAVTGAFLRATPPRAPVGGGYLTIVNSGEAADRLLSAEAAVGREIQIHRMAMEKGVMTMQALPEGLSIPAGASVSLRPGGDHLMIMGLTERLIEGETLPITLRFERAGEIEAVFDILALNARRHPDSPADSAAATQDGRHGAHGPDAEAFDQSHVQGDEARIDGLLRSMFETPDSALTLAPLLIEGDLAIVGWTQAETGGRALLRRSPEGLWKVDLCAGEGLKGAENLIQLGLAPDIAERLAARQAEAEAALAPDHAARLSLFDGVLHIEQD